MVEKGGRGRLAAVKLAIVGNHEHNLPLEWIVLVLETDGDAGNVGRLLHVV